MVTTRAACKVYPTKFGSKDFLERVWHADAENLKYCHAPNKNASADTALDVCFLYETPNKNIHT